MRHVEQKKFCEEDILFTSDFILDNLGVAKYRSHPKITAKF